MAHGVIKGKFKRASGKFFELRNPASDLKFENRGGKRPVVVAVFDPVREDYRIKIWLEREHAGGQFTFDDAGHSHDFFVPNITRGFHTGTVNKTKLWRMLQGMAPFNTQAEIDKDENPESIAADELKDFCIETRFDLQRHEGRYGGSPGDVSGFPEWMHATGIQIDKETRGSGTYVYLQVNKTSSDFQLLRINGVWCPGMPTSSGGGNLWIYQVPPEAEDEVREYGDGLTQIAMPNEPRPPRFPRDVRRICTFLRDNGDRNVPYRAWRDDAQQWNYKIHGMCMNYGQRAMFEWRRGPTEKRLAHYQGCINRNYNRAKAQGMVATGMGGAEWAASVGGEPAKWARNVEQLTKGLQKIDDYIARFTESYEEQRAVFEEITARLEEREEQYAEAIELLHPKA